MNTLLLIGILLIAAIWLLTLTLLYLRWQHYFRALNIGINQGDIRTILEQLQTALQTNKNQNQELKLAVEALSQSSQSHFQRIGFIRYNPFSNTGGDQSFCICILDGQGNGIVVSSLHSRDQTRIYAKRITDGHSRGHTLSKEERAVIQEAMKG